MARVVGEVNPDQLALRRTDDRPRRRSVVGPSIDGMPTSHLDGSLDDRHLHLDAPARTHRWPGECVEVTFGNLVGNGELRPIRSSLRPSRRVCRQAAGARVVVAAGAAHRVCRCSIGNRMAPDGADHHAGAEHRQATTAHPLERFSPRDLAVGRWCLGIAHSTPPTSIVPTTASSQATVPPSETISRRRRRIRRWPTAT